MKDFEKQFLKVIKHEGYYANVSGDRGGETYMGVARNLHPSWSGWGIVDSYKEEHGELKNNEKIDNDDLTELVKSFYFENFFKGNNIHLIESSSIQEIVFDWCVNSGRYGSQGTQRTLNEMFDTDLVVDGVIGAKTIEAINHCDPSQLFQALKDIRIVFYHTISKKGQNHKFLKGWLKRINAIVFISE